jgi:hypothetical protein
MRCTLSKAAFIRSFLATAAAVLATQFSAFAQGGYEVVSVSDGGTISGSVKWSGPMAHILEYAVTKDVTICDPDSHKTTDLERLIVGPERGVANTVVYLKNIPSGKALDLPKQRRHLDQLSCRYIPHILLVPASTALTMTSSDATLHIVHMDGAASFNLPFPFPNQPNSRVLTQPGLVHVRCNGGHNWMNAEMMVVQHPYYAVTDDSGKFQLSNVPPGTYQIVAWHEGWGIESKSVFDVSTETLVNRPLFSDPKISEKSVSVLPNQVSVVNFSLSAN